MNSIYIAGPIKGIENPKSAFDEAKDYLTKSGYVAVSPMDRTPDHEKPCPPGEASFEGGHTYPCYVREGLWMVLDCDTIYLLRGWEQSAGARLEFLVAQATGKQILYEQQEDR